MEGEASLAGLKGGVGGWNVPWKTQDKLFTSSQGVGVRRLLLLSGKIFGERKGCEDERLVASISKGVSLS